jgi:hypothetical protein
MYLWHIKEKETGTLPLEVDLNLYIYERVKVIYSFPHTKRTF